MACKRNTFNFWHYTFYKRLALDNNRHNYRSTSCDKIAVFCEFASEVLYQLTSFYARILDDWLFIYMANPFEYLFMDIHHLIRMNEPSRIDKYVPNDSSCMSIFLENKGEDSIFSKFLAILKCIACNHADRLLITIKSIKCEFERIF